MMVRSRRVALATMITAVALAAALLQTIAQASSADSSTRINAGGPAVQDAGGATWLGDRNFKGGTALTSTTQVSGTTAPEVYDNARVGMTAYQIPVAAAGTYRVRLLFAELQHAQAGQRVFTVRAEGRKFVSDLDLAAVAGYAAAYDVVRDVSVTDGTLNVKFVNTVGVATVSAIEVVPLTPATTTTTAAATSSTTTTTAAPTTTTAAPTTTTTTAPTTTTAAPTTTTTTAPTTTTSAPTTTSTTTTTAPPPVSGAKLSWAPPALTNPITLTVGTGGGTFNLTAGQDYLIRIPQTVSALGGVRLVGGRNIVLIGGHITIPYAGTAPTINDRRALYLAGQTGTVHIEGLLIDNTGGDLSEGIQINAPDATIQLQNLRITGVHARDQIGFTDNHPDIIQAWGGAKELRIDRLSGSTDYQGLFLKADYNTMGRADLRNINLWGEPANLARYLTWQGPDTVTFPLTYTNVWVAPAPGRTLGKTVWPDSTFTNLDKRAIVSADGQSVTWPTASQITGTVRQGTPTTGDYVPNGTAGTTYTSPGYTT